MHEASLMRDLMSKILALAAAEGADRVTLVGVRLGALSHMSPEHFTEHYQLAAAGTCAQDATLAITTSDDIGSPDASHVVLERIEVQVPDGPAPPSAGSR